MKLTKIVAMLMCVVLMCAAFVGCAKKGESVTNDDGVQIIDGVVTGEITLELYRDKAPITVQNFVDLANKKFYDGLTFHRIIEGFMVQGGDPEGTGMGGSPNTIKGEYSANGVENDISHLRGVISMARQGENPYTGEKNYDSASSQFFICHKDSTFLDGQYAAFGKVIEGMEVVDALATVETGASDAPVVKQYMKEIRVISEENNVVKVKITVGK